ncbi:MAG: hypothetical protein ACYDHY_11195 [Acidiferrobacterales bacterium]
MNAGVSSPTDFRQHGFPVADTAVVGNIIGALAIDRWAESANRCAATQSAGFSIGLDMDKAGS